MDFKKYPHLERFTSSEVEGILVGECHVFPKLDGTNASIWYNDGELMTGSRNRLLVGEGVEDNAGFNVWVQDNKSLYLPFFEENPGLRLFGEWLVKHTVNYTQNAYRRFYVFDVVEEDDGYTRFLPYSEYVPLLEKFHIAYVPLLCTVSNYTGDWKEILEMNRFCLDDGCHGEGIVVKRYDFINRYGRQTFAKVIGEVFRETKGIAKVANTTEEELAKQHITQHTVDKERAKLQLVSHTSIQGRLLEAVWYDFCKEILPDIAHKTKLTINFPALRREITNVTKSYAKDLF